MGGSRLGWVGAEGVVRHNGPQTAPAVLDDCKAFVDGR